MTLRISAPLRVMVSGLLCTSLVSFAGCAPTPEPSDLQQESPSASVPETSSAVPGAESSDLGGFRLVFDDAEFQGQELIVRNGQPWEMRNFTMTHGEYRITAERGTFDPTTSRYTMENGTLRVSPTPNSD